MDSTAERTAVAQAAYFVVTGVWPLLHRRSFEAITGRKTDFWLAQCVGGLVAAVGAGIYVAHRRGRLTREVQEMAATSAAALGALETLYALRGRISKVYLGDAALEALFVAGWARARTNRG